MIDVPWRPRGRVLVGVEELQPIARDVKTYCRAEWEGEDVGSKSLLYNLYIYINTL